MNFDPIGYCITKVDLLEDRLREMEADHAEAKTIRSRLASLEAWRKSWEATLSKWPYLLWLVVLIGLNVAPEKTVDAVIDILKAAL